MAEQRIKGCFDSRGAIKGSRIILGDDGKKYIAHYSEHLTIANPAPGQRVSFLVRVNNGSLSAYEILRDTSPQPARSANRQVDIQRAAEEALRLKRERRDDLVSDQTETMPPGTRVFHPDYGLGEVVKVYPAVVSVRFENQPGKIIDTRRSQVTKASARVVKESGKPWAQTVPSQAASFLQTGSTLAGFIREMVSDIQQTLTEEGLENNDVYQFEEPWEPPTKPVPLTINSLVSDAFRNTDNITGFYSHQIQTRAALLRGNNVIISTPTASGKTEAYNPTILEELLDHPNSTALYLFPLVALGIDQTERLEKLNQALPESTRIKIGIYNSSVSYAAKQQALKEENRILVTTPDSMHYLFLPKPYPNWKKFYKNLRYVVVDEAHVYKGVIGSNMANILRRLLVRCRREGNPRFPQMIISSATVRHPAELAHQLTGLPTEEFEVISESGAPKPARHFLVTRSDIHDVDTLCSDLLNVTTPKTQHKGKQPVSTIVFLRSINEVKRSVRNLREHLKQTGRDDQAEMVEEYYSDKGDKNDVLVRLRAGKVRCLFTTTALMAGIDVGSLDVAIVKHFPGLVMDARQMFGRAGRSREGAVIFIANRIDPFDQFYFDRPKLLFNGPIEDIIANPENPILLAAHLKCAAQTQAQYNREGPLSEEWVHLFGPMGKDLLDALVSLKSLKIQAGFYHLNGDDPHDLEPLNDIRAIGSETYILQNGADGKLLEKKRGNTAFRDAHQEALVWVNGNSYEVVELDQASRVITCQPKANSDLRTRGMEKTAIEILSTSPKRNTGNTALLQSGVTIQNGKIRISTSVETYLLYRTHPVMQCRSRSCHFESPDVQVRRCPKCGFAVRAKQVEEVVDELPVPSPVPLKTTLESQANWLNFPEITRNRFDTEFWPRWSAVDESDGKAETGIPDFGYAIHSLKHAILKAFPEYIPCDRDEIGGVYALNVEGYAARLFIYDNFPGGLGLSDEIGFQTRTLLKGALDLIERCTCSDDHGCPVCLAYFGCHDFNKSISKLAGRYLLRLLLDESTREVLNELKEFVDLNIPADQRIDK